MRASFGLPRKRKPKLEPLPLTPEQITAAASATLNERLRKLLVKKRKSDPEPPSVVIERKRPAR